MSEFETHCKRNMIELTKVLSRLTDEIDRIPKEQQTMSHGYMLGKITGRLEVLEQMIDLDRHLKDQKLISLVDNVVTLPRKLILSDSSLDPA